MDISILKKIRFLVVLTVVVLLFASCKTDLDYNVQGYQQKIIVEGKIESDGYASVYLSLNVPLTKQIDSATVIDYVIRFAKVTVSDGEHTEILTSQWDKKNFPPYVYRSTSLRGEPGKSYSLKVEYSGYTLYANTSIPSAFHIEKINSVALPDNDSMRVVEVLLNLPEADKNAYRFYTKKSVDRRFVETPVLLNANLNLSGLQTVKLSPQPSAQDSSFRQHQYFLKGDSVALKVCRMDSVSTQFYKRLTMFSTIGSNITSSEIVSLPGNISNPGLGIWSGQVVKVMKFKVN